MAKKKALPVQATRATEFARICLGFDRHPRLSQVRTYLLDRIGEPFPLRKAAGIACLERKYFGKVFIKRIGINFKCWLDLERVFHAQRLLVSPESTVSQVASDCGLEERTLQRLFKRVTGMSPSAFKRLCHRAADPQVQRTARKTITVGKKTITVGLFLIPLV